MCPVCLATAAIIAGSATGTGGLTALVVNTFAESPTLTFQRSSRRRIQIDMSPTIADQPTTVSHAAWIEARIADQPRLP